RGKDLVADLPSDAGSGRGVFGVRDHEVGLMMLAEGRQADVKQLAARPPDDIADEEEPHDQEIRSTATSIRRPRRSAILGSVMRSSPAPKTARARRASHAAVSLTARANRPNPRSTR